MRAHCLRPAVLLLAASGCGGKVVVDVDQRGDEVSASATSVTSAASGGSATSGTGGAPTASAASSTAAGSTVATGVGGAAEPPCGSVAPSPDATFVSDPPANEGMTPDGMVLHKELSGYSNYGVLDAAADILYDGQTAQWVFEVPYVTISAATVVVSVSADDHYGVPISSYACELWAGDACVAEDPLPVMHGTPYASVFTAWYELTLPVVPPRGGVLVVTLSNLSKTADPLDWLAADWVELRLTTN